MNIMAMNVLAANTGIEISFLDWTAICMPIALVLLAACWLSVTLVFRPEPISAATMACIEEKGRAVGRLETLDWKVLGIMGVTFALWIASNWTGWDATAIAVLCLVLFFLPGLDVLTWREYTASVSWSIVLLIGCVQSLSGGVKEQGAASWLFGSTVGKLAVSGGAVVGATAALLPLLRLVIPVGPAFIAICLIPLASLSTAFGVSPVVFTVIVAVNASTTFLMGVDSNNMLSFRYGYWKMTDFFKAACCPRWPWWRCTPPCSPRSWRPWGTRRARAPCGVRGRGRRRASHVRLARLQAPLAPYLVHDLRGVHDADELLLRVDAHLLVDVVHVRLGRVRRDVQLVGDELGVAPFRQVVQDLALAVRQLVGLRRLVASAA